MENYYLGLTKRQLFKAYRDVISHANEMNTMYNTGKGYYDGVPIYRQCTRAAVDVMQCIDALIAQGIATTDVPNVPTFIARFSIDARRDVIKAQQQQYLQAEEERTLAAKVQAMQPAIAAMGKLQQFMYNYPHGFIQQAFTHMVDHLQAKFDAAYAVHGPRGVMPAFLAELDAENKKQLFSWIICNYGNI